MSNTDFLSYCRPSPPPWPELHDKLLLRRHLFHSLTDPKDIGSRSWPAPYQTHREWEENLKAKRKQHVIDGKKLWESQGLRTRLQVTKRIAELDTQIAALWHAARPDLYGPDGELHPHLNQPSTLC